jgi:2-polyprenyl-3-methyl-5-hydroxy-6-metoxy-1,4-benzoquinol methylase
MDARSHGYETSRSDVRAHVPRDARLILDLGCSTGALGAALKRDRDAYVVGVEIDPEAGAEAAEKLDRVVVSDVESFVAGEPPEEAPFDCLIAADVLEHLVDPWQALDRASRLVRPRGTIVVSVPNVIHWRGLARLVLRRRWPRDEAGPFDATHLRWFTGFDAEELVRGAGADGLRIEPRFWSTGWRLRRDRLLARTPLRAFIPVQFVVSGARQADG